jgi:hypothetical protein
MTICAAAALFAFHSTANVQLVILAGITLLFALAILAVRRVEKFSQE